MKVALKGLFAAGLAVMPGAADAASIVDSVIANARSQWNADNCRFNRGGVSCTKHRAAAKKPAGAAQFETSSAKSTVLDESTAVANTARPATPVGQWIVDDDDRRVQIMPCGQWLCGIISAARPDAVDRHNPDPGQRNRTIVNLPVLIEMVQTQDNRWEGQIYNTKDGRVYSGRISLKTANLLEVEGNAPHGLLLQTWIKDGDDLR